VIEREIRGETFGPPRLKLGLTECLGCGCLSLNLCRAKFGMNVPECGISSQAAFAIDAPER
jgi:hypothetical protein